MAGTPYCRLSTDGDVFVAQDPELDETAPQPPAMLALMVQRLLQLGRA